MKKVILVAAVAVLAFAVAPALWLVLDDGGVRRLGAIDAASTGQAGRLTLVGVNGGSPIPIDSFGFRFRRSVGAAQPEADSIEVTLPLATSMTQLLGRAVQGTKAATGRVELIRSLQGTPTAYLTFDLTNVSLDGFADSYMTGSSGGVQTGTEKVTLRYDAMTMTCIPSACAQPTHTQGAATELAVPDAGALAVRLESGSFSAPKVLKDDGSIAVTATMGTNYLLPGLLSRLREGKAFEKPVQVDLVRTFEDVARKSATYKLGNAALTSLAISGESGEPPVVQAEFSARHFGVTTYAYTAAGALDKSPTFCFTSCAGL